MILVGASHKEYVNSTVKLMYLLEEFKPKKVSLEFPSSISLTDAEKLIQQLRERVQYAHPVSLKLMEKEQTPDFLKELETLERIEGMGYEVYPAIHYCRENDCELRFVDYPEMNYFDDEFLDDLACLNDFFEFVLDFDSENKNRKDAIKLLKKFIDVSDILERWEAQDKITDSAEYQEMREQYMADRILEFKPDVHIGGSDHVFGGGLDFFVNPLYKRLEDKGLELRRIRL